jgi:hypothetical protein
MNKSRLRTGLVYGFALLSSFALEHAAELLFKDRATDEKTTIENILTSASAGYQRFVTFGYRKPRAHYVRLVMLDPMREPNGLMNNLCEKREMYGHVVRRIVEAAPASIVIDATFGPDKCAQDDPHTVNFVNAVRSAIEQNVPFTMGLKALTREEIPIGNKIITNTELLAQPSLTFAPNDNSLNFGHVRLNADVRKIPLYWPTFFSVDDIRSGTKPISVPSLAYFAASTYDSLLPVQPRLSALLKSEHHPFSSFIREDQFPTFEALDLVCGTYQTPKDTDWTKCHPGDYGKAVLRGHIVVVGERTSEEFRDTEVGRIPGVVLQANYIESLLDDRYFVPVPVELQVLLSFLVFGFVEFTFRKQKRRPGVAFVYTVVGITMIWAASWVLLAGFGRLLLLWIPGVFALIGKYVDSKLKGAEGL